MDPRLQMLMLQVLDGEAAPEECRELVRLLAEDEAAREEYASLRLLFERLHGVPQVDAPQGLAEAAVDRRQRNAPPGRRSRSSGSSQPRRGTMSPNRSKRSIWISGGIAAAILLAAAFFTVDYPPERDKAAGTVAPAQRYRAEQPKAGDVQLGDQAVARLMQTEAFDRFVKDPSTRALAADARFHTLARTNAAGLLAMAAHPEAASLLIARAKAQQADAQQINAQLTNAEQANAKAQVMNAQLTNAQLANAKGQVMNAQLTNAQLTNAQEMNALLAKFGPQADAVQRLAASNEFTKVAALYPAALTNALQIQGFGSLLSNANLADALVRATQVDATQVNAK